MAVGEEVVGAGAVAFDVDQGTEVGRRDASARGAAEVEVFAGLVGREFGQHERRGGRATGGDGDAGAVGPGEEVVPPVGHAGAVVRDVRAASDEIGAEVGGERVGPGQGRTVRSAQVAGRGEASVVVARVHLDGSADGAHGLQALDRVGALGGPADRRQGEGGEQGHQANGREQLHQREAGGVTREGFALSPVRHDGAGAGSRPRPPRGRARPRWTARARR